LDPARFSAAEPGPNWAGLGQAARAARIHRFIELSNMLGAAGLDGEPPEQLRDVIATVHVKVLLLAWAYDRTYGFIDRLFNGPLQYRDHRQRANSAAG